MTDVAYEPIPISPDSSKNAENEKYHTFVNLALALAAQGKEESAAEAADMLCHILVGLRAKGVSLEEVSTALKARQGVSGLDEKASRSS